MNNFPTFNPNQPLLEQISSNKLNLVSLGQKSNQLQSGVGYRLTQTAGGTTQNIIKRRHPVYNHPWKVTVNGNDEVTVGEGRILSYLDGDGGGLASISLDGFGDYAGGVITVTGAGVIYGSIPAVATLYPILNYQASSAGETGDVNISLLRVIPDLNESITVAFDTTLPKSTNATVFYWAIATVDLVDGKATIVKQILRHDPPLWSFTEPA